MKQHPFFRSLLALALIGTCSTSFVTCTSAYDIEETTDTAADTLATTVIESVETAAAATAADEEDIEAGDRVETYFAKNNGGWNTAATDTVKDGVLTISQSGGSVRTVTKEIPAATAYNIEFRAKMGAAGSENGFKLQTNKMRVMMYFGADGVNMLTDQGMTPIQIKDVKAWHTYNISVNGRQAMLYVDGELTLTYSLPDWTGSDDLLTFFVKGGAINNIDYVKYSHADSTISLTSPMHNASFVQGGKFYLKASCGGSAEGIPYVDYYANDTYIGTGTIENNYNLEWSSLVPGVYVITAKYGDFTSISNTITVVSTSGSLTAQAENEELTVGESTTLKLKRVPNTAAYVTYYANGKELAPAAGDNRTAVYTADTVGKVIVIAKVTHNDGSHEYSSEVALNVTASSTAGVVLQSSYAADYIAAEGGALHASDGMYALDISHSANGVTYVSAEGTKTYALGLGNYKVQVDGGNAEVYYNGQYAFSFLMPVTTAANGVDAVNLSGITLSGVNATRITLADNTATLLPDFKQDYAVEWVLNDPSDFVIDMNDGVYNIDLEAKNGEIIAQTYPNGDRGVVEEAVLCTLPAGRHVYRLIVSNGIAQLFIDNVWTASLRLPVAYSERYAKVSGTGTVYVRETADLYIHNDSFDGTAELASEEYWRTLNNKITATFDGGAMTLAPNANYVEESTNEVNCTFDTSATVFNGSAASVADGIMTVTTDNSSSTQTVSYDVPVAKNFEFEIKFRVLAMGPDTGIKLEYADSRIMSYLGDTGYRVQYFDGSANQQNTYALDLKEWHTIKYIITDGKQGELFIDGKSQGSFTMPNWNGTSAPKMAVFTKAPAGGTSKIEVDYAKFTVLDEDVEVESTIREATPALIKAYAYNPTVKATVRVDSAPAEGGGVYIAARYDNEYRNILAGYNFDLGAWEIVKTSTKASSIGSTEAAFPYGKDINLELTVNGDNIALYVNGEREVSTNQASLSYYGNVGIAIDGVTAVVSDFSYSGTGRAMPGADTFINDASSPEVFEYADGHILVIQGPAKAYESTDDGYTWEKVNLGKFSNNTIRLKSGTIVYTTRASMGDGNFVDNAYVSTDNGATFEGPFPIQNYLRNRITMPNKLTEGSTGRLFFASGESGDGVEGEGGVRVFYSDDEGRTWTGANMLALDGKTVISGGDEARMDAESTGVNCQESRVVEMPDGTLRLYHRTDEGFLYYSVSTDNGATWTAEMWASEFISVLSAFNIEYEPETGWYYMAWEYNNKNDHATFQRPRTRTALAISYDGMQTWEYVGDIHETSASPTIFDHMNISLKPTEDAIYVTTVYYPVQEDGSKPTMNYFVRVDKDTLKTTERFTNVHALKVAAPTETEQQIIDTMLLIDSEYANIYASGKIYNAATPTKGYIPASIAAAFVGASTTAADNTVTAKIGAVEAVFTAGSTTVTVNGEAKTISAAPVMNPDGMYVPVDSITTLFNRKLTTLSNGATISINEQLAAISFMDEEELGNYLPTQLNGTASSAPVSEPSSWAAAEVNAALAADIVPASLKSAYQNGITRAEFCTLIMTMLNKVNGTADSKALVEKLGKTYADNFTDTDNADIICANLIGIVNGRGNGIFDPTAGITRQEAAVMLANASKVLGITAGTAPAFTDIGEAGTWAHDAIGTVASIIAGNGSAVMGGTGNGGFSPLGTYTREQSIMTVYRLFTAK